MLIKIDSKEILAKMEDLCLSLLAQDGYKQLRKMIDGFAEDEQAVDQYEQFMDVHRSMQSKEEQEAEFSPEEIELYEREEQSLYENDTIRQFLYAQREFSHIHNLVTQYFTKTVELNRLPESRELKSGGCGCDGNCGCGSGH